MHRAARGPQRGAAGARVLVGFDHPDDGHIAVLPEPVRAALAEDFAKDFD